jgi:hypothetical protein
MQIRKKGGWNFKKIFSSETTEPISTKLCWNDSWMAPFQNCVCWSRLPTKMQFWPFEEISIFSNRGYLEWRAGLSDTILKGTHPGTIPARFGLIWVSGFRGEDLNVIKIEISSNGQNCSILSQNVPKFELCKHNDELFSIYYRIFYELWTFAEFDEVGINGHNFGRGPSKNHFNKVWLILAQ